MTMTDSGLRYKRNAELRAEIAALAGVETDRYGPGSDRGLNKAHLLAVADRLGVESGENEEPTLARLYELVCEAVGETYEPTTGNQWGLQRKDLKAIHRALEGREW